MRDALAQQPARPDLAAGLLVVGDVQFDPAGQRRAALVQRQHREGVGGDVAISTPRRRGRTSSHRRSPRRRGRASSPRRAAPRRHARSARSPARPARSGLPHHEVGRADHAVGLDEGVGHLVPLDDEAQPFQQLRDRLGGAGRSRPADCPTEISRSRRGSAFRPPDGRGCIRDCVVCRHVHFPLVVDSLDPHARHRPERRVRAGASRRVS